MEIRPLGATGESLSPCAKAELKAIGEDFLKTQEDPQEFFFNNEIIS